MSALAQERCEACEGGIPPLERTEAEALLVEVSDAWRLAEEGRALERDITFKNFARAMEFLNRLATVAEAEGHHPDFCVRGWNKVHLRLSTHAIQGLSRNDFILAAKLDEVVPGGLPSRSAGSS